MKFLLMWSFLVGSQWVTGTAYFNDLSSCLEVKKTLLEYKSRELSRTLSAGW